MLGVPLYIWIVFWIVLGPLLMFEPFDNLLSDAFNPFWKKKFNKNFNDYDDIEQWTNDSDSLGQIDLNEINLSIGFFIKLTIILWLAGPIVWIILLLTIIDNIRGR